MDRNEDRELTPEDATKKVFVQKIYLRPIFDLKALRERAKEPGSGPHPSEETVVINNVLKRVKPAVFRFG